MSKSSSSASPMTLEEARAVMWLRNNHKPLGQLLDEGYLNRARLEWAAERAYDPRLRQAATLLLDSLKPTGPEPKAENPSKSLPKPSTFPPLEIDMTMEQARATVWPMRPFKGQPMGTLVDTKQLSLKDLAYAIENAWDKRVKLAAVILMAMRLDQSVSELPPPAGPMHVVSGGRSYAEASQYLLTLIQGLIGGAGITAAIFVFIWSLVRQLTTRPPQSISRILASPIGIVIVTIVLGLGAATGWLMIKLFDSSMNKLDAEVDNYRKGEEGEDRVVEIMRQVLDGSWYLFRNVNLPGRNRTDLDGVLVGPSGIWVLEVKSFSGKYRNVGDQWDYRKSHQWKSLKSSPSRQAQGNALRLSNFLKADNIKQWVIPVVVWANPDGALTVENPAVAVWSAEHLPDEIGNAWQNQTVIESDQKKIVEKLTKLCQAQAEAKAANRSKN